MFRNNEEILKHISNHLNNRSFSSIEVKVKLPDGDVVQINMKGETQKQFTEKANSKPSTPWVTNQIPVKKLSQAPSLRS
ncbi:hypothetical protein [Alkalihalobacillus sp. TS-13]|uniref:hypothetical protein n=1 Tax=Alkalihalobacillus sp. TS-13 TaxID=2842455 RepID=UPI001C8717DD|nr:hypothetical protein [Alkalihalobacillus sp. TS-13]